MARYRNTSNSLIVITDVPGGVRTISPAGMVDIYDSDAEKSIQIAGAKTAGTLVLEGSGVLPAGIELITEVQYGSTTGGTSSDAKASVELATTAPILLTGIQVVDVVATATGDRILVKNQLNPIDNGVYLANNTGAWQRSADFNTATSGAFLVVIGGTTNIGTGWVLATLDPVDVGVSPLIFIQFSGGGGGGGGTITGLTADVGGTTTGATVTIAGGTSTTTTRVGDIITIDVTGGAGSPSGNTGEIQFNTGGSFDADSNLFWDDTNKRLGVGTNAPDTRIAAVTLADEYGISHTDNTITLKTLVSATHGSIGTTSGHPFGLYANDSDVVLSVDPAMRVGIADPTLFPGFAPAYTLHVEGSVYLQESSAGSNSLTLDPGYTSLIAGGGSTMDIIGVGTGIINIGEAGDSPFTLGMILINEPLSTIDFRGPMRITNVGFGSYIQNTLTSPGLGGITDHNILIFGASGVNNGKGLVVLDTGTEPINILTFTEDALEVGDHDLENVFIYAEDNIELETTNTFAGNNVSLRTDNVIMRSLGGAVRFDLDHATNLLSLSCNLSVDGGVLAVDATNNRVGILQGSPTSSLDVNGTLAGKVRLTATNATLADEFILGVTNTSAPRSITVPLAASSPGRMYIVKDESFGAGTNNITLLPSGSDLIEGATLFVINVSGGVARIYSNGANWINW